MVKSQSYRSRLAHAVWRIGGNAGILVALLVTFFIGYLVKGFLGSEAPLPGEGGPKDGVAENARTEVWTCSMHPQIQQPKPGKCPLCGMDLIPLSSDGDDEMAGMRQFSTSEAARELMNIQTSLVEQRFVTAEIRMVGKIDYDETKLGYITAWVPGRIDRLYVDYTGIEVKKGDHLVYLYSPELLTTQDELHRAADAVENMNANAPDSLKRTAETSLDAARDKLRRWGLTAGQIREAESKGMYSDHVTIYAPTAGTVIHRNGQEGMYVKEGTKIYTIADLSAVWVLLDAYESDLAWLHYGQKVEFVTEAYPGVTFTGKIAFIDPVLNERTRTTKVRVNVSNQDRMLKPEMFVRAVVRAQLATGGRIMNEGLAGKWIGPMHPEIIKDGPGRCDICNMPLVKAEDLGYVPLHVTDEDKPLVIPASAPLITGTRAIVYVEMPGKDRPTYEGREVVLGARAGSFYIVRSGLEKGERVVTNGNFKIDSALQIMAKPSMMAPSGGGGGGGHDHGGGAMKDGEAKMAPTVELSFASREQLDALVEAYRGVSESIAEGDTAIKDALNAFGGALDAVDMALLSGDAHKAWMELSMRLKNDVVEAVDALGTKRFESFVTGMDRNMAQLRMQFGLGPHGPEHSEMSGPGAPAAFQEQLGQVYQSYLGVPAALASDQFEAAAKAVATTLEALEAVEMSLVEGEAHMAWMRRLGGLNKALDQMKAAEGIEEMRSGLAPLSDELAGAIDTFGVAGSSPVYKAHCPMALDGQGADWLQADTAIRNPYYGEAMLECGNVVGRLDRKAVNAPDAAGTGHKEMHNE